MMKYIFIANFIHKPREQVGTNQKLQLRNKINNHWTVYIDLPLIYKTFLYLQVFISSFIKV